MSDLARLSALDIAKGIGIILVILGHSGFPCSSVIYSFHMPLFFLISGYFLSCKGSLLTYVSKRTKQLMLPYIYTALAGMISMLAYAVLTDCGVTVGEILKARTLANLYGLGWYFNFSGIHIQMAGTIWFLPGLLISLIAVRIALKFEYPFLIVLVVFTSAYLSLKLTYFPLSLQAGLNASLFVYIGYVAKKYDFLYSRTFHSWWSVIIAIFIWSIAVLKIGGMGIAMCRYSNPLVNIIAATSMSYILIRFSFFISKIAIIEKSLSYIGVNTLFIFCIHAFTQASLWSFSPEYNVHPIVWHSTLEKILFMLFTPLIALVVVDIFKTAKKRFSNQLHTN